MLLKKLLQCKLSIKDNKVRKWLNHFEQQQHQDGPVFAHQKDLSSVITVSKRKKYWLKILPAFQNDYLLELNNNEICHIWWNLLCGWKSFERKKNLRIFLRLNDFRKYIFCDWLFLPYLLKQIFLHDLKKNTFFWK